MVMTDRKTTSSRRPTTNTRRAPSITRAISAHLQETRKRSIKSSKQSTTKRKTTRATWLHSVQTKTTRCTRLNKMLRTTSTTSKTDGLAALTAQITINSTSETQRKYRNFNAKLSSSLTQTKAKSSFQSDRTMSRRSHRHRLRTSTTSSR